MNPAVGMWPTLPLFWEQSQTKKKQQKKPTENHYDTSGSGTISAVHCRPN